LLSSHRQLMFLKAGTPANNQQANTSPAIENLKKNGAYDLNVKTGLACILDIIFMLTLAPKSVHS